MNTQSLTARVTATWLFPILLLTSLWILVRGHNEPGGGFVGGLFASAAYILHGFVWGYQSARSALPLAPESIAALGVLLATTMSALGPFGGNAFFTGLWWQVNWPGAQSIAIGTPLVFDIGVYLAVSGGTLSVLLQLIEKT